MTEVTFRGFAGLHLQGDDLGSAHDPTVLLLHSGCEDRTVWRATAEAMVRAGRRVVNLDLRGHGRSGRSPDKRYDLDALVGDLRAVLAQIEVRPVIIAGPLSGWIATVALSEMNEQATAGLILVDMPPRLDAVVAEETKDRYRQEAADDAETCFDPAFLDAFDHRQALARIDEAAARLRVPTLIIRSGESPYTTQGDVAAFASLIQNCENAELGGFNDLLSFEAVDVFNALVLDFLERKCPRMPQAYVSGSDTRLLRNAMGCFATGVCVVTAKTAAGQPIGLTVNSFTSVSLEPPLVLICIARSAGSLPELEAATHFAINILHIGQQEVSNLFARPGEDRFAQVDWEYTDTGIPILTNSLGNIECHKHALHEAGDHVVFLGEVERVRFDQRRDPLLYYAGKYRRLHLS